ncbi:MAG TPA: SusE domain-containing protein [Puia sp.]|nr:SusE domain-containing protein [Puia sp.]
MKRYFDKLILLAASGFVLLTSCNKNNSPVYFEGGTAPTLTSTATDSISLPVSDTTATAVTFTWTNPNYQFSDGISSLDVSYYLELDTVGGNFSSPALAQIGISSQLSATFTVAQFNTILSDQMNLETGAPHNIQVRIESFLAPETAGTPNAAPLYSNAINYAVNPYTPPPAVTPLPTALWITGSATADGWMTAGDPASIAGQQMTEVSPTLWTITMPLIGGQQFLLVPANNWNNKYATSNANSATTGGTFQYNAANNFNGPTASGTYTVTFNFQTGNYTITQ